MNKLPALALIPLVAGVVGAQTLSGIKLDPTNAKVGEPVKITGSFDSADNPNCSVRVHFGDGQTQDFKINQAKDVPLVTSRSYAKAGEYKVMIEPKTALPMLKCNGKNQSTSLTVTAPAPVAAAAPKSTAGLACPAGWTLNTKSVKMKSGAFTCGAKAGTVLPAVKPECPAPLAYFENRSKGQLGCKP